MKNCMDCIYYDICEDNAFGDTCSDFSSLGGEDAMMDYINDVRFDFRRDWFQYIEANE